jgi:hypothetical protein
MGRARTGDGSLEGHKKFAELIVPPAKLYWSLLAGRPEMITVFPAILGSPEIQKPVAKATRLVPASRTALVTGTDAVNFVDEDFWTTSHLAAEDYRFGPTVRLRTTYALPSSA